MWYERGWQWAKEHLTITVPGVVLIFAATFIVILAVNAGEVGAAWVQAVGSIAAIGVAIFVAELGHRRDRLRDIRAEALEDFRVAELAVHSVDECYLAMSRLLEQVDTLRSMGITQINTGRLDQAAEVLRAVLQQKLSVVILRDAFKVLAHVGEVGAEVSLWTPVTVPEGSKDYLAGHIAMLRRAHDSIYREYLDRAAHVGEWVSPDPWA